MAYFNYNRRKSSVAQIGDTQGGENLSVFNPWLMYQRWIRRRRSAQAIRMIEAGAEYCVFTAQGEREAQTWARFVNN